MAKQRTKTVTKKSTPVKVPVERKMREPRSPKTNLYWAVGLALVLLLITGDAAYALSGGIFAFLFFNTVDYMIFYYRYKKGEL